MTEQEFRIKYSKLMDDSQALEDELKRYYALCNSKDLSDYWDIWNNKLGDSSFGQLLNLFKGKKYKKQFTDKFYSDLLKAKDIRNYYAHHVFLKCHFKKGLVPKIHENKLRDDYIFINNMYHDVVSLHQWKIDDNHRKHKVLKPNFERQIAEIQKYLIK